MIVETTNLESFIANEEKKIKEKEDAKHNKTPVETVVVNPCKDRLEKMLKAHKESLKETQVTKPQFHETIN